MATVKISELNELSNTASVTAGDLLHIINVEEFSQNYPYGTNKKIKAGTLANGLAGLTTVIPPAIQSALDSKVSITNFNNAGLKIAAPVAAATTAPVNLAATLNTVFIDDVQLAVNDRLLVKNQTTQSQNGIYVINTGAPTRATDFDSPTEINGGYVLVNSGSTQKGSGWAVTSTVTNVGTDSIVFTQFTTAVTNITKTTVGLGNVDNTSDLNKPLSNATLAALAVKQGTIVGAAESITTSDLAINRALVSSGGGKVAESTITNTELGSLANISGNVQTLLNAKAPNNNPAFTGTVTLPTTTTVGGRAIDLIPSGAVMAFAMNSAPAGWLIANGDTIPNGTGTVQGKTENFSTLYGLLGTTYGALGKLPDLRGQFVRGFGTDQGSGPFGANQEDIFKAHTHGFVNGINYIVPRAIAGNGRAWGQGGIDTSVIFDSGTGTETRPKNIAMLYCIKI